MTLIRTASLVNSPWRGYGGAKGLPVASSASWPNEPGGSTLITDYAFSDTLPYPASGDPLSDGWSINNGGGGTGRADRVTEGSEPISSPYSAKVSYPTGFTSSSEPANMFHSLGGISNVYMGMYWKVSNPWQYNTTSDTNKMIFYFFGGSGGDIFMQFPSTRLLRVTTEMSSEAFTNYDPNVNSTAFALGTWNLVELLCKKSPSTLKWWLNGQLLGDYTSVTWPSDSFAECDIAPTWGGSPGESKTEDDAYWYDHIHLSHT